jgi:hypothetical protein
LLLLLLLFLLLLLLLVVATAALFVSWTPGEESGTTMGLLTMKKRLHANHNVEDGD